MGREGCPPHHWQIEPPLGPTSLGACEDCGVKREFSNRLALGDWTSIRDEAAEVALKRGEGGLDKAKLKKLLGCEISSDNY